MELDSKLWTSSVRVKVWHCLQDKDILDRMVKERSQARVQVVDMKVMCWGGVSVRSWTRWGLSITIYWVFNPLDVLLAEVKPRRAV